MWVSELTISCLEAKVLEALQYDLLNACIVHFRMLWFSAPTSLNDGFLNIGVALAEYNEAVNLANLGNSHNAISEDAYTENLLLEIDTYCVDQHA